jgi:hypothetical protein
VFDTVTTAGFAFEIPEIAQLDPAPELTMIGVVSSPFSRIAVKQYRYVYDPPVGAFNDAEITF